MQQIAVRDMASRGGTVRLLLVGVGLGQYRTRRGGLSSRWSLLDGSSRVDLAGVGLVTRGDAPKAKGGS